MRTHWRTGTNGIASSTKCAARSVIRRPPQLGQNPRPVPALLAYIIAQRYVLESFATAGLKE